MTNTKRDWEKGLKRYECDSAWSYVADNDPETGMMPVPDGPWVKLEDVRRALSATPTPRLYRGREIKDAPEGRYATKFDPAEPDPESPTEWRNVYAKLYCITHAEAMTDKSGMWVFFGPIPRTHPNLKQSSIALTPKGPEAGEKFSDLPFNYPLNRNTPNTEGE